MDTYFAVAVSLAWILGVVIGIFALLRIIIRADRRERRAIARLEASRQETPSPASPSSEGNSAAQAPEGRNGPQEQ